MDRRKKKVSRLPKVESSLLGMKTQYYWVLIANFLLSFGAVWLFGMTIVKTPFFKVALA